LDLDHAAFSLTPKRGGWLNMAVVGREVAAWATTRHGTESTIDGRSTTEDARITRPAPLPGGSRVTDH